MKMVQIISNKNSAIQRKLGKYATYFKSVNDDRSHF